MNWQFSNVWNQSLIRPERELEPRQHIWASEIGGALINRYYKMNGVKPTNPPSLRAMRKFQAGMIWEDVVRMVLMRAGLIIAEQQRFEHQMDGCLNVTGKCDFIAGGTPDLDKAERDMEGLPEHLYRMSMAVIQHLREFSQTELDKIILEVKSCSDIMFSLYERTNRAADNHICQAYHYLISGEYNEAHVVYINKDNCFMLELPIYKTDEAAKKLYVDDITAMTYYINAGEVPPKEKEVYFDPVSLTFRTNWKVEYSDYLTMIYGYERPDLYSERWKKEVSSMNRVFKRCVNGDNMTKANLEVIAEAKKNFPEWDDLVSVGMGNKELLAMEEEE